MSISATGAFADLFEGCLLGVLVRRAHAAPARHQLLPPQMATHLPTAEERLPDVQLVDAPLLCLHRQVDSSIVFEIWNGIVPQLQQMGLLAEGGRREQEPRLTMVFDRNGWSPRLFRELRAIGIAVVTWIKGPQKQRWPDSAFRKAAIPARHQRQPALVTTHPSLAAEQVAGLL